MSFFFTKQPAGKRVSKPAGKPAAGPSQAAAKAAAPTLRRLGCKACPLNHAKCLSPKIEPIIPRETLVYFLGEQPGRIEDDQGAPLRGGAAALLRECIPEGDEGYAGFDELINCRPKNDQPASGVEIECCRPRREQFIEKAKPKLIVGLGPTVLQAVLGTADMYGYRGRMFLVRIGTHTCWFMPTYHPQHIIKLARDKHKALNSFLGHCFRMDIAKAFKEVGKLPPAKMTSEEEIRSNIQCFDGTKPDHAERVLELLRQAKQAPTKAVDIETQNKRPYSKGSLLLTVALSFGTTNFAFALDHPKAGWQSTAREVILDALYDVLADDTVKIAHNAPFEIEWFIWRFKDKRLVNHSAWECTMMQAHFIDERKGKYRDSENSSASRYQGLGWLCKQHFGVDIKTRFKLNKKNMKDADLGETLVYNGADTKYTLRLYERQNQILKRLGTYAAYLEALPRQPTVALMQSIGVWVNPAVVTKYQNDLGPKVKAFEDEIFGMDVVKQYVKDNGEFKPGSQPDLIKIFRDYLKRPEITVPKGEYETAGTGDEEYSAKKDVLDTIDHPLAKAILAWRTPYKLKSTYIDPLDASNDNTVVHADGRLHTSYNTCLAETGRLSSDSPNLQNWPKRKNAWARSTVEADPDCVIVAADYGQLEGCTAAMCSKDAFLVKALWEDYDIHMEWAQKAAKIYPPMIGGSANFTDKKVMKDFRSLIKNKLVFPAFFGASNNSVRGYLSFATNVDVPQDKVDKLMDMFWDTFNGFATWQEKLMKGYYTDGFTATLSGRRRLYPMTRNQAINHPVQGSAAELVCDAMIRLSHLALTTGRMYLHPVLNIHDDLTFIIPKQRSILEPAIETIIREMIVFKRYNWVNVPMSVEVSVGPNWHELKDIGGKFWSNKMAA